MLPPFSNVPKPVFSVPYFTIIWWTPSEKLLSPNTSPKRILLKRRPPNCSLILKANWKASKMIWANRVKLLSDVPTKLLAGCCVPVCISMPKYTPDNRVGMMLSPMPAKCSIPPMDTDCVEITNNFLWQTMMKIPMLKKKSSFLSVRMVYKQRVTEEVTSWLLQRKRATCRIAEQMTLGNVSVHAKHWLTSSSQTVRIFLSPNIPIINGRMWEMCRLLQKMNAPCSIQPVAKPNWKV